MQYGLKDIELKKLHDLFSENRNIKQVILYGSRAKGTHKPFSDIDIALVGTSLSRTDMNRLHAAFDETSLPYKIDITLLHSLKNNELIDHINRRGIVIYQNRE